nr:immunoglobulin heavy chain junction region [Mus musculus]
CARCSSGFAYW